MASQLYPHSMPVFFHTNSDYLLWSFVSISELPTLWAKTIYQPNGKEKIPQETNQASLWEKQRVREKGTMADVHCNLVICLIKYNHIYKETLSSLRFYFYYFESHKYQLIMSLLVKNGGFGTGMERQEDEHKEKELPF